MRSVLALWLAASAWSPAGLQEPSPSPAPLAPPQTELGLFHPELVAVRVILPSIQAQLTRLSEYGRNLLLDPETAFVVVDAQGLWRHRTRTNRNVLQGQGLPGDLQELKQTLDGHPLFKELIAYRAAEENAKRDSASFYVATTRLLASVDAWQAGEEGKQAVRAMVGEDLVDSGLSNTANESFAKAVLAFSKDARDVNTQLQGGLPTEYALPAQSELLRAKLSNIGEAQLGSFVTFQADEQGKNVGTLHLGGEYEGYFVLDPEALQRFRTQTIAEATETLAKTNRIEFFLRAGKGQTLSRVALKDVLGKKP